MEYLFDGVKEFNSNDFSEYKELFEKLGRTQTPHTLFIGCSDSKSLRSSKDLTIAQARLKLFSLSPLHRFQQSITHRPTGHPAPALQISGRAIVKLPTAGKGMARNGKSTKAAINPETSPVTKVAVPCDTSIEPIYF